MTERPVRNSFETLGTRSTDDLECEFRIGQPPGHWAWVLARGKALGRGSQGQKLSAAGFALDISARKKASDLLHLQGAALESAANAMMITAPDGTIEWVNPAFEALTGYSSSEAVGKNPRILKSGEHDDACYRELWATISHGQRLVRGTDQPPEGRIALRGGSDDHSLVRWAWKDLALHCGETGCHPAQED